MALLASDVPNTPDMPDVPATEENTEVQESVAESQSPEEQAPEEPSELQMYLSALSPDPVEMTMGEVFLT